jgi:hypothetical protein
MTPREDVPSSCSALARKPQRTVGIRIRGSETGSFVNRETSVHTRVIPRAAICRASTRGSLPSGDPSSNPDIQTEEDVYMYAHLHGRTAKRALFSFSKKQAGKIRLTIPIFTYAVRWCIGDEHDHLARMLPPVHLERLREGGGDRLGSVTTS